MMRIPNFIDIGSLFYHIGEDIFKKGSIIEGEILEVNDDLVLIHIKGLGIIKAVSERPLKDQEGKVLSFIVRDFQMDSLQLKPVLPSISLEPSSNLTDTSENHLTKVLKEFGIKASSSSIDFLKDLMKSNIPINKDNIVRGFWLIDKLEHLINLREDTMVVLANPKEERPHIGNEDIRNFIIIENFEESSPVKPNDLTFEIKELVKDFPNFDGDNLLQKTILFFMKYNIKPSLKNIKYFLELEQNPVSFSKDFEILEEFYEYKFTNFIKRFIIDNDGSNKNINQDGIKYTDALTEIINLLQELMPDNEGTKEKIEELINKCNFLREMNKDLVFVYLPINIENDHQDTIISFLKKRKQEKGHRNNINIFINLNTKRLGQIKIRCLVSDNYLDIKFSGISKDDIPLFKSKEGSLRNLVESTGYKIRKIEYLDHKPPTISRILELNTNVIYNLDIKV